MVSIGTRQSPPGYVQAAQPPLPQAGAADDAASGAAAGAGVAAGLASPPSDFESAGLASGFAPAPLRKSVAYQPLPLS
jgi:hypothetical protein